MFGSFRLLLALMVALSHVHFTVGERNIGVIAVVGFFMLSGYVVAALLAPGTALARSVPRFYLERSLRLLPLYYFFMAAGVLLFFAAVASPFLQGPGTLLQWLVNLLVIPLNYHAMAAPLDGLLFVPPAWSLGLEMQFYLLAPWLMRRPRRLLWAMALSFLVSIAAHTGLLHTDWFGYRLLFGNLFMFASGAWLYQVQRQQASAKPLLALWLACLALFLFTGARGTWSTPFTFEVLLGFLVALPLVATLGKLPRQPWDDALGHLAYGVFLGHFAVLWAGQHQGWLTASGRPLLLYLALVLVLAWLAHHAIERPLHAHRRRLR